MIHAKAETNSVIIWCGAPCELSLSKVSDRTAQLVVAPLDDQGQPRPIPPTAAFVTFPTVKKISARELAGSRAVQVGEMRFIIKAKPLTVSAYRADGRLVQEFVLDAGTNGTVSFHTDAPVFGLGEGGEQFDRRGHFYPMNNGQISPMLAEHGATIP
ncbi:MAG TPA: hypothetical protein VGY98_10865, partial [Verrucomicrobiae bacterium]|nr:hypothetical protein [Verrucomicrobiae bacterium]